MGKEVGWGKDEIIVLYMLGLPDTNYSDEIKRHIKSGNTCQARRMIDACIKQGYKIYKSSTTKAG